jgi:ribulose-phosphate 3-epimerase
MINSASIINCNFLKMGEQIEELVKGGAKFFHIDLMDGHYVPNLCFPAKIISDLKEKYPQIVMDIHMMVTNPIDYIPELKERGADYVCFHTDSTSFVIRTLKTIRDHGMKPGIAINPSQRIDHIEPFIKLLDMVLLMTVEPGFSGQKFLDGSLDRLKELSELREKHNCNFLISVDGGVNYEIGHKCKELGADVIITTIHTVFNQPEGIYEACRRFEREFG